jgi:hypothetical protein
MVGEMVTGKSTNFNHGPLRQIAELKRVFARAIPDWANFLLRPEKFSAEKPDSKPPGLQGAC